MQKSFPGYYRPTTQGFADLWINARIVFDTSALLSLYQLHENARLEVFSVLELIQSRVWIPHHVGLEFHRNRETKIIDVRKLLMSLKSDIEAASAKLTEALNRARRSVDFERPTLDSIDAVLSAVSAAADSGSIDLDNDPILAAIDRIVADKIGVGPSSQNELDAMFENGRERYERRVPPGYEDRDKKKSFSHEGLLYQEMYGDLIIWQQTMAGAKCDGITDIILVTEDTKTDWWLKESGETHGPRPELIAEMAKAGIRFWAYRLSQFIEQSEQYLSTHISEKTVVEIKEALDLPVSPAQILDYAARKARMREYSDPLKGANSSVLDWLGARGLPYSAVSDHCVRCGDDNLGLYVYPTLIVGPRDIFSDPIFCIARDNAEASQHKGSSDKVIVIAVCDPLALTLFESNDDNVRTFLRGHLFDYERIYPNLYVYFGQIIYNKFVLSERMRARSGGAVF
jgi:hypothetical protein